MRQIIEAPALHYVGQNLYLKSLFRLMRSQYSKGLKKLALVGAVGIELKAMLKARKLLIP